MLNNQIDAIAQINSICSKEGIELAVSPEEFFSKRTKRLFTSAGTMVGVGKIIFRFSFGELLISVEKEILLYTYAQRQKLVAMPELIKSMVTPDFNWLVYRFCEGSPAGNVYQFDSKNNFQAIFESLDYLENNDFLELEGNLFNRRSAESWMRLINVIKDKKAELTRDVLIKGAIDALTSISTPVSGYFAHGDLHPGNIIVNDKSVKIIDWESAHFDCFGFDLSFVYIRSHDKGQRNKILSLVDSKTKEQKYGFYYTLCVNLLRDYFEWHLIEDGKSELMSEADIINDESSVALISGLRAELEINLNSLAELR